VLFEEGQAQGVEVGVEDCGIGFHGVLCLLF
jgi:hypothetical protein